MEIVLLHEIGRAPHKTDHVPRHKERENCKISRDRQRKRERQKLANRPEIEKREADPKLWFSLAHCEPMASSKTIQWRRGIGKCTFTLQLSPPPSLHYLGDNKFPALRERAAEIRQLFPANTYVCRMCARIKAHIQLNFMIRTAVHPPVCFCSLSWWTHLITNFCRTSTKKSAATLLRMLVSLHFPPLPLSLMSNREHLACFLLGRKQNVCSLEVYWSMKACSKWKHGEKPRRLDQTRSEQMHVSEAE